MVREPELFENHHRYACATVWLASCGNRSRTYPTQRYTFTATMTNITARRAIVAFLPTFSCETDTAAASDSKGRTSMNARFLKLWPNHQHHHVPFATATRKKDAMVAVQTRLALGKSGLERH